MGEHAERKGKKEVIMMEKEKEVPLKLKLMKRLY